MTTSPDKRRPQIADADYYRLGYQLAAQLMNREAAGQDTAGRPLGAPPILHEDPLAVAMQLLRDARSMLAWYDRRIHHNRLRWRVPTAQEQRLRTFLAATIEPSCALLAARRLHQLERADEATPLVEHVLELARADQLSYRAYYALACLEANDGDDRDAILYLGRALYKAPRARRDELAEWALQDPAFASVRAAVEELVAAIDPQAARAAAAAPAAPSESRAPFGAIAESVRLASAYQLAERTEEAVALDAEVVAELEALLGPEHPAALAASEVLLSSRKLLRRAADRQAIARRAIELREELLRALAEIG